MFQYLISFAKGTGALNTELNYISKRMDEILKMMLTNSIYKSLVGIMAEIGIAMLLVYFLIDLLDKVADVQFTPDIFFKQLIKFVIGFVIMSHLTDLLVFFADFSTALTAQLATFGNGTGWATTVKEVNDGLNRVSSGSNVSMTNGTFIKDLIFAVGFQVVIQFTTWELSISRALKIGYKSIMAPIACADMITNGMSSNGIRYLKDIFALYLQTTVVLLAVICTDLICLTKTFGLWTGIVGLFILRSSIKNSQEIATEMVGL